MTGTLPGTDPDRFTYKRLFGRDGEHRELLNQFSQLTRDNAGRIVMLHGPAGIGKSALIQSFQRALGGDRHGFAAGKCTRAQNQPQLFPFGTAMAHLIGEALVSEACDLRHLRETLLAAVRGNETIVADHIPELYQIIGQGWRRPDLPLKLIETRICTALAQAVCAFAHPRRPLILAIDDIQWADSLSLSFIASLARCMPANLMLILSFRDPWSDGTAPDPHFVTLIDQIRPLAHDVPVRAIPQTAIGDLLAARLGDIDPRIAWLADSLGEMTGGNPLALVQRLHWLREEGAIVFDQGRQHWTGRRRVIIDVVQRDAADDPVKGRIARLTPIQRGLIEVLAVLAVPLPPWLIAEITGLAQTAIIDALIALADMQILRRSDDDFAMFHDRVLDTVVGGLSMTDKAQIQIAGACAIVRHSDALAPDWHFRAASLMRDAIVSGVLPDPSQRLAGASHLLTIARINRQCGALDIAAGLTNAFRAIADPRWWDTHYAMMIDGEFLEIDILLANGLVELACQRIELLQHRARTDEDRAQALQYLARVLTVRSDYDGAIQAALSGLDLLGVQVPRHPTRAQCDAVQRRLDHLLSRQDVATLVDLPPCEDPRALLISQLLAALLPALFDSPNIRFYHVALLVEFTLLHGICPASPYGLSWYGVTVADAYHRYADGMALGRAALAIIDWHGFEASRTETLVAVDQLSPWVEPAAACLDWVDAAIKAGQASLDLGMTCYARNHLISDLLFVGAPLDEVEREADSALELTRQIAFTDIEQLIAAQRAFVRLLRFGEAPPPVDPAIRSPATLYWVHLNRAVGAYMTGDDAAALRHFAALEPVEWSVPAHIDTASRTLFTALAIARVLPADAAPDAIAPHLAKLRLWAGINPDTFVPKLKLVEGELARIAGDGISALAAFDTSARLSAGLPHNQAIAHDLAAALATGAGLHATADLHRKAAIENYVRWGAKARADVLEGALPDDPAAGERPAILTLTSEAAMALSRAWFDETDLPTLRMRILECLMDLCRARSAAIFAVNDGGVERVAQIGACEDAREPDWLADIARLRKATMSIAPPRRLTLPLLQRGELIGAVDLRDHRLDRPLLARQVYVLKLLSAQAEIALSSARLHTQLAHEADKAVAVQNSLRAARIEMARNSHWIALGEFAATLSHEINQPLSGIVLNAAAARRWLGQDAPVIAEAMLSLDAIASAAARTADIVRATKALTRQEPPSPGKVDINHLVADVCAMLENEILQTGVVVTIETANTDLCVIGDKVQLQQVIMNLFINAMDALDANPVEDRRIGLAVLTDPDTVSLRIDDNGPGIPDPLVERIFMPLVTSKHKGTGMGLAICKSIMAAHNGDIRLVPRLARGCSFVVELPLERPA